VQGAFWPWCAKRRWGAGISPWLTDVYMLGGLETTLEEMWQINTPESPFYKSGSYLLLTAPTERGTLTPLCDIGITALSVSQ